ncbi:MAG TPA: hypothetical protein VLH79_06195 [Chthonomonadales bacterium]|nr:hypothetical protein [Chthonomonadales bacterium]
MHARRWLGDVVRCQAAIRLAIDGRREDGWYFVSQVSVMRSGP